MKPLKIVFAGTPDFGIACLEGLLSSAHVLQAVYTQPDRPAGRGRKLQASAIKQWALSHEIEVFQPVNFKNESPVAELRALAPDVLIVIAYGLILPACVLNIPRLGCINVHASLLPKWRGASPIQHAVLHGDTVTGVSIMQMDIGMDTGDVLATRECLVEPTDTALSLQKKLALLAVEPLLQTINTLESAPITPTKQDSQHATFAGKIAKDDALINWSAPATTIDCLIRAYNPWPVAFTYIQGERMRIYKARISGTKAHKSPGSIVAADTNGLLIATQTDDLLVEEVQFPGGKVSTIKECLQTNRASLFQDAVGS